MKTIKQIFDTIIGSNTMLPIDLSVEKFPFIDNYKENQTLIHGLNGILEIFTYILNRKTTRTGSE